MRSLWRLQTQIRVVNAFRGQLERRPSIMIDGPVPARSPLARARFQQAAARLSQDTIDVPPPDRETNV